MKNPKSIFLETKDTEVADNVPMPWYYETTYYGADLAVKDLVRQLRKNEILIPPFQRQFVWKITESSRFIESLLLDLPVPGIFLAQESATNKYLVIDGQQRLKSLLFFYQGVFKPSSEKHKQPFRLTEVIDKYQGLTYATLPTNEKQDLDTKLLYATIVKQESSRTDDTGIYQIYERLNLGGQRLLPQEIRCAIYHGKLIDLVNSLNDYSNWRSLVGEKHKHLKDQELILRFLAMYFSATEYKPPLLEFINIFTKIHRNPDNQFLEKAGKTFTKTLDAFYQALGNTAFRRDKGLNAAIFDSMMYGLAHRLENRAKPSSQAISKAYHLMLSDPDYLEATTDSTANASLVSTRLKKAKETYAKI